MVFKCADNDVMDLTNGNIINSDLLPVKSWGFNELCDFLERRTYTSSNQIARTISMRALANPERNAYKLGLSDSYWICTDDTVRFDEVSPYYNDFGTLLFAHGFTEPTLQLGGTFHKQWERVGDITYIVKEEPVLTAGIDVFACTLAGLLGVGDTIVPINETGDLGLSKVYIRNLSSPDIMLLDFGSIYPNGYLGNGYDINEVADMYCMVGFAKNESLSDYILKVNLFDAIVSNFDRYNNQGNWGFFKNTSDGTVSHCPAYDFNLASPTVLDKSIIDQRSYYIHTSGNVNKATSLLNSWSNIISSFCEKHDIGEWLTNFNNISKSLKSKHFANPSYTTGNYTPTDYDIVSEIRRNYERNKKS